jgi:hypothetical protein
MPPQAPQNRALRKIYGHKREKVTEDLRKLYEELHDSYSSPDIIPLIKSWRMRWTVNVTYMAKRLNSYRLGNMKERDHLGNLGLDGRILLKWILKR